MKKTADQAAPASVLRLREENARPPEPAAAERLQARRLEIHAQIAGIETEAVECNAWLERCKGDLESAQRRVDAADTDDAAEILGTLKEARRACGEAEQALSRALGRRSAIDGLKIEDAQIEGKLVKLAADQRKAQYHQALARYEAALRGIDAWGLAGQVREAAHLAGIFISHAPGLLGGPHGYEDLLMVHGYPLDISKH